jgi:WD domain, G-beta repeat
MKHVSRRDAALDAGGNGSGALRREAVRVSPRDTPYKGLMPYDETDAPFFFGREPEREIITANLMGSRLTLVYGPSGVGKSSVLRAGVVHGLREMARREQAARVRPKFVVVFYPQKEDEGTFNSWHEEPLAGLRAQLRRSVADALGPEPPLCVLPTASLADELKLWADCIGGKMLVVLDQFEEYFLYPQKEGEGGFAAEFARAVNRQDVGANFIVSLREDWLAKLDRFKVAVPNLFDNYLRLRWLDAEAARLAIEKPVALYNETRAAGEPEVGVAEGFSDDVIEQLARLSSKDAAGAQRGEAGAGGGADTPIQTPYLQLVMTQLWGEALRGDGHALRPEMLKAPLDPKKAETRAEEIIQSHLDSVMGELSEAEQDAAARAFYHLVTPGGTKIALSTGDLIGFTGVAWGELEPVLKKLSRKETAVLTQLAPPPEHPSDFRYEIFHDVLAPAILAWRARYLDARRKAEARAAAEGRVKRRVKGLAWGLAVAALIIAGVTVLAAYSVSKRREAEAANRGLEVAQQELKTKYDEVEIARRELKDKNDALVKTQGIVARQNVDLSTKNESLISASNALADKVEELKESQGDLAEVNEKLRRKTGELQTQYDALARAQSDKDILNEELEKANGKLEASNEELSNKKVEAERQNAELIKAKAELQEQYNDLSVARGNLASSNEQLTKAQAIVEDVDKQTPYFAAVARVGAPAVGATLAADSKYLVGAFGKSQVGYWDVKDTKFPHTWLALGNAAALSTDGRYVVGANDKETSVYDCGEAIGLGGGGGNRCAPKRVLSGAGSDFSAAAFDGAGRRVAIAGPSGGLRVWDADTGRVIRELSGQAGGVAKIAFGHKDEWVAAAGPDEVVRVWNVETGALVAELRGHKGPVYSVAFDASGDRLIAAGDDGTAIIWDVPKRKQKAVLRQHREFIFKKKKGIFPLAFKLTKPHRPKVYSAAFSLDGNFIATGGEDGVVRVWDTQSNTEVRRLSGHNANVRSVAFDADGYIVSAGEDGTVRVWNPCKKETWPRVDLDLLGVDGALRRFESKYCAAYPNLSGR